MNTTKVELEKSIQEKYSVYISPIFSTINVALSCVGVMYISFSFFDISPPLYLLLSGFLATFSIYSLNMVTDVKEDIMNQPQRLELISHKKIVYMLFISSYFLSLLLAYMVKPICVLILLIPLFVGIIYSIEIRNFRLKKVFLGKNISISFSWAIEASLLPFIFYENNIYFIAVFSFIFLKGMVNTILFDLRDVKGDSVANIKTVPNIIGKKKTIMILFILNTLLLIWIYLFLNEFSSLLLILILWVAYGYAYLLFFCYKNPPRIFYSILIDDEWLLWMFIIMLLK
ncbi:MAG TPA: hypothetical protein ENI33_02625 [Thermoplasmatales archaeon]|nr:hypothetical protein [Thermoplasmatales archaeon]